MSQPMPDGSRHLHHAHRVARRFPPDGPIGAGAGYRRHRSAASGRDTCRRNATGRPGEGPDDIAADADWHSCCQDRGCRDHVCHRSLHVVHPVRRQACRRLRPARCVSCALGPRVSALAAAPSGGCAAARAPPRPPAPVAETLTLSQAEESALRNQPTLRQAHAQTDAAEGRVEQARSGYLPQAAPPRTYQRTSPATSQPRPAHQHHQRATGNATLADQQRTTTSTSGLTASQLIYDFGQTSGRWRRRPPAATPLQVSELTAEQQALLAVRARLLPGARRRGSDQRRRARRCNQQKHLDQIQAFVGAGIRPEIDLAQARTAVANARVQLVTAANNHAVARARSWSRRWACCARAPTSWPTARWRRSRARTARSSAGRQRAGGAPGAGDAPAPAPRAGADRRGAARRLTARRWRRRRRAPRRATRARSPGAQLVRGSDADLADPAGRADQGPGARGQRHAGGAGGAGRQPAPAGARRGRAGAAGGAAPPRRPSARRRTRW